MPAELTIEQLAAASGMSVRNIRAHQARGLIDPPEVRLRVGYYGPEHVERLTLIRDLQADGFNLAGIERLLDDDPSTVQRLARVRERLAARPAEAPLQFTLAELGARFRVAPDRVAEVLARAHRLGVLVPAGEGRYTAPSPALLDVAERVAGRGVSLDRLLEVFEDTQRHCDAVAGGFVSLFLEEVWAPFQAAGLPPDRWREIDSSIAALRPLAGEALQAIFAARMSAETDAAFGELLRRLSPEPGSE